MSPLTSTLTGGVGCGGSVGLLATDVAGVVEITGVVLLMASTVVEVDVVRGGHTGMGRVIEDGVLGAGLVGSELR